MTVELAAEQLYCRNCSDPVDSLDEGGRGRCCHNLPSPWVRGAGGLYNRAAGSGEDELDDDGDPEDVRPQCPYCGGRRFRFDATEWRRHEMTATTTAAENELEDDTLWYDRDEFETGDVDESDNFEVRGVVCMRCQQDVSGSITYDERY